MKECSEFSCRPLLTLSKIVICLCPCMTAITTVFCYAFLKWSSIHRQIVIVNSCVPRPLFSFSVQTFFFCIWESLGTRLESVCTTTAYLEINKLTVFLVVMIPSACNFFTIRVGPSPCRHKDRIFSFA